MKALILNVRDRSLAVEEVATPKPGPKQVLVRVRAIALNHVDSIYSIYPIAAQDRRTIGSDFAGEVIGVGDGLSNVNDARAKIGARVAGFVQGAGSGNERPGAFAEYVAVDFDLTWNVPTFMSLEQASTVSLCGLTAAQGVFARLQLPCPFFDTEGFDWLNLGESETVNVLIYGATSSVGLYAAQLVRLAEPVSGRKIRLIGVASTSKHAMLRSAPYGYDILVDYQDKSWPDKVREATPNKLGVQYAIDAISQGQTVGQVESTFGPQGKFVAYRSPEVGGFDISELRIKPITGAVWEGLGVEIDYHGTILPANPEARMFATEFFNFLGSKTDDGLAKLQPNPVRQMPGGLEKVAPEGLRLFREQKPQLNVGEDTHLRPIAAEKVVYST